MKKMNKLTTHIFLVTKPRSMYIFLESTLSYAYESFTNTTINKKFKLLARPILIYLPICVICLASKYCNQSTHGMIILHKVCEFATKSLVETLNNITSIGEENETLNWPENDDTTNCTSR